MSGIVGSKFNIRGSGLVGSLGTDGQHMLSSGAGVSNVFETVAAGADYVKLESGTVSASSATVVIGEGYISTTYENYLVYLTNFVPSTDGAVRIRFNEGGAALTGAEYEAFHGQGSAFSSGHVTEDTHDFDATSARFCGDPALGGGTTMGFCAQIWLPQLAQTSPAINAMFCATGRSGGIGADTMRVFWGSGTYDATGAKSGITIIPNSGTLDTGEWVVYGLKS